jgi:hypothetical protein
MTLIPTCRHGVCVGFHQSRDSKEGEKKMNKKWYLLAGLLVLVVVLVAHFVFGRQSAEAATPPITDAAGNELPGSIAVIETVTLGGLEQTITIRGADTTNPVMLFLHGGPGMPSSPWASWNNIHADLEQNFVLVHWDQRGRLESFRGTCALPHQQGNGEGRARGCQLELVPRRNPRISRRTSMTILHLHKATACLAISSFDSFFSVF